MINVSIVYPISSGSNKKRILCSVAKDLDKFAIGRGLPIKLENPARELPTKLVGPARGLPIPSCY
jgi:hypothetical protein